MRYLWAVLLAMLLPPVLGGCAESVWAPEEEVQRALYRPAGPAKIALVTVQSTRNGSGGHSGLIVTGEHRALFDPAGTFYHPAAPERNDVHFGITENVLKVYIDYHARETFDVLVQEVEVPPEVASRALSDIQANGPVFNAMCAVSVSRILSRLDGFESIRSGMSPMRLSKQFATLPGATFRRISDDDADTNHGVLLQATKEFQATMAARN